MKFLLYISLLLSLLLIVMGTVLAIYNHSIFAIYVVFGLILFILILMVIRDEWWHTWNDYETREDMEQYWAKYYRRK